MWYDGVVTNIALALLSLTTSLLFADLNIDVFCHFLNRRGTMDVVTTKALSLHLRALLPPTSTELDIAHNVQVAAILGLGLVYQGTAHRHTAEVLLSEIGGCLYHD